MSPSPWPMASEHDMSAEEILSKEGRESVEERIETLEWVLGHDDPDLTAEEQSAAESRLEEFHSALEDGRGR